MIYQNDHDSGGSHVQNSHSSKQRMPWLAILALGMGMLVYGIAESYGPIAAIGNIIPSQYSYLSFSLPYIAGGVGSLLAGILTDRIGRRSSFLLVAGMILVGITVFLADPRSTVAIVLSFILIGMAAIGLETPIITEISEVVPAKWRGNVEVIVQNFGNVGVALVFIPVLLGFSAAQSDTAYAILFIAPIVAMVIGYWSIEESKPWDSVKGKANIDIESAWKQIDGQTADAVNPTARLWFRLLTITVISIVQDVAFVWITYNVAYYYFAYSVADLVPLLGGIAMLIVGVSFGLLFAHRRSRKSITTFSYLLLVALWAVLWIYVDLTHSISGLGLLTIMVLLFIPTELTWGTRAMLTPELFSTKNRGTYVSIVRAVVWITTGLITLMLSYYVPSFNIASGIIMAIFLMGLILSLAWQLWGFETGGKSLSGFDVK